jgi:hypothetical protein
LIEGRPEGCEKRRSGVRIEILQFSKLPSTKKGTILFLAAGLIIENILFSVLDIGKNRDASHFLR